MWELDCEETWAPINWCFWTVVLEKTLESSLDCKEIQLVNPKGDQSWVFIGRTHAEAETPVLWPPHAKSWLIGKDLDDGRDWGQEEEGTTEDEMAGWHHQLDGHEFEWTPGVGDGQRGLVCCNSWGRKSQTRLSDWTELNWWPTRPSRMNTIKRCPFHHRWLKCKSRKSRGILTVRCGLRVQNEAGQRLTEFCQKNEHVIANTLFHQPKRQLYTWTSPMLNVKIILIICFAVEVREALYTQHKWDWELTVLQIMNLLPNSDLNWRN